jgi:hypothetical protein
MEGLKYIQSMQTKDMKGLVKNWSSKLVLEFSTFQIF